MMVEQGSLCIDVIFSLPTVLFVVGFTLLWVLKKELCCKKNTNIIFWFIGLFQSSLLKQLHLIFGIHISLRRWRSCLCVEQRHHRERQFILLCTGLGKGKWWFIFFFSKSSLICSWTCLINQSMRTRWRPSSQLILAITSLQLIVPFTFPAHLRGMKCLSNYHVITWGRQVCWIQLLL